MSQSMKKDMIVPAICTQCGAKIKVDPSQDASICAHCNTAFIVEKAIRNYHIQNIQNANVEHIDTVNINTTTQGNASSALYFIDKHLDRRNRIRIDKEKLKIEKDRLKAEKERIQAEAKAREAKYIPILAIVVVIVWIGLIYLMRS